MDFTQKGVNLATAVARLLSQVVPKGFTVAAVEGVVTVRHSSDAWSATTYIAEILADRDEASLEAAALAALSMVQDFVSETSREPWPAEPQRGRSYMALAQAKIVGGDLRLWYGEADQVREDVGVIPLSALGS